MTARRHGIADEFLEAADRLVSLANAPDENVEEIAPVDRVFAREQPQ